MATSRTDDRMTRRHSGTLALDVLVTVVVALVLLALWHAVALGDALAGLAEGARLLFLFMDVGLGAWVIALVVLGLRARRGGGRPGVRTVLVTAVGGVALNALAVLVIGLAQGTVYLGNALLAGAATLLAAAAVVPALHRARAVGERATAS